ncbi:MAG: LptA/OstA family protein [Gammaproteobacteria bacterium]
MAISIRKLSISLAWIAALAAAVPGSAQQAPDVPDVEILKSLPIDLDATSSEFDRKKNRLVFRDLRIRQGPLSIDADQATATRLDFENTRWEFSGNVRLENTGTTAWADYADILFEEHQIRSAAMTGQPVRFEQIAVSTSDDSVTTTRGRANALEYDVDAGIVSMIQEAWLSDGSNEVSGDRISYDLKREIISADANDSGQVRMKIIPPEDALSRDGVLE